MFKISPVWRKRLIWIGSVVVVLAVVLGITAWYKFFRVVPEEPFASLEERFKYGSLDAENDAGLPYWIWVAMPRVCPQYLPGPGGYRSLGIPWEEGHEMPVGFTKRVIGFPRVANNCASCHTASYRTKPNETPIYVAAGPNHTAGIQGFLRFVTSCAKDDHFNPDTLLAEIEQHTHLGLIDRLAYRYLIIPRTKKALTDRAGQLGWMNRQGIPDWRAGRHDPMNLTKSFMTAMPWDSTVGSADFPSTWDLDVREGMSLSWGGETPSPRSVIIDSALGLQANPKTVEQHAAWIQEFLRSKRPPKYPFPVDSGLAAKGQIIYAKDCAYCHAIAPGTRVGTVIDVSEVGTDANRLDTWTAEAARIANQKVASLGITRKDMVKTNGYQSVPLDGLWLRAPYLHNGSVPNLRELLEPQARRTKIFWNGFDVYDSANVGFDTQSAEARRVGFRFDTSLKGNGNQGHLYGTKLSAAEKQALLEYMKTL